MSEEKNIEQEKTSSTAVEDDSALDIMELEMYRKMWSEINTALADIRALRSSEPVESDPMQIMRSEIAALKKHISELRDAIANMSKPAEQHAVQNQQQPVVQQFPQMQPTVPLMPYFSTPNYQPLIQIPH